MRNSLPARLVLAGVALLLAAGCSDNSSTTTAAGPTTSAPAATTTVAPPSTTRATSAPTTTVPAGPAVVEAGGWRMVISAPTNGATIGPTLDVCYEVTGAAREATVELEVSLVIAATGTVASTARVPAGVGRGSARASLGTPQPRRYDMTIDGIVNGQHLNGLTVRIGIDFAAAPPTGCP